MATCLNPNAFACPHEYLWVFWSGTSGRNLRIKHDGPNSKRIITAYIAYRNLVQNILVIHPADITLTVGRPNFGCLGQAKYCHFTMFYQDVIPACSTNFTLNARNNTTFEFRILSNRNDNRNHPSRFRALWTFSNNNQNMLASIPQRSGQFSTNKCSMDLGGALNSLTTKTCCLQGYGSALDSSKPAKTNSGFGFRSALNCFDN